MNWFLVKMIFRIVCGDGQHQPQFDEQLRLITATDRQHAWEKARTLGEKVQERFLNQRQQWVCWQFVGVTEVTVLEKLDDEVEVYYQVVEPDNVAQYLDIVQQKAAQIARKVTSHAA